MEQMKETAAYPVAKASKMKNLIDNVNGRVGVPILLWFLGVPGFFVLLLWFFIFRGR